MRIAVCASMSAAEACLAAAAQLRSYNIDVVLPKGMDAFAQGDCLEDPHESTRKKIEENLLRDYFGKISECDAILVVNEKKNGIAHYIGGNTFLEMGFAHVLNKTIYLLHPVPDMPYSDEILAMEPVVLDGSLELFAGEREAPVNSRNLRQLQDLAAQVEAWAASPEGQQAIEDTCRKVNETIDLLEKSRRCSWKQLQQLLGSVDGNREVERLDAGLASRQFAGYVLTCQQKNTREWMEGLAEEINRLFSHIGNQTRWEFDGGGIRRIGP